MFVVAFVVGTLQVASIAEGGVENLGWTFNAPRAAGYNINLDSAKPAPGTPLLRGASVSFKVSVSYALEVGERGAIILVFQDDRGQIITGDRAQTSVEVTRGRGTLTLTDSVVVPAEAKELRLFIPLVPSGMKTTTGEVTVRYPIATTIGGPQYIPYPLASISAQQWKDFHDLVERTYGTSRREFSGEHLEVFHSSDNALHFSFTTVGHPAHPAWITRQVEGDSVDQIGYFAGSEESFAELFRSYLALTDRTFKNMPKEEPE
jgi:hypothetical protein